jgi:hypothetical protein
MQNAGPLCELLDELPGDGLDRLFGPLARGIRWKPTTFSR